MQYLGDFAEDSTLHFKWSTNDGDGASITRSTDGTVHVYKDDATGTESTSGVTDTEDFDGLTGIHHCKIDLSADAFYATGADYSVVLKASTIDGQTVNAVLANFSIENRFMRGTDNVVLAGPTKAEMDTAHALLSTEAKQDIIDTNVDTLLTRLTATRATYLDYLFSIYFGLVSGVAQAQGGAATSITLKASASSVTDFYKGQTVVIYTGTGAGQARAIWRYNNGADNKIAEVNPNWATAPDATSWYVIINVGSAIIDDWIDGGRLDLLLDAIKAVTDNLPDSGALSDLAAILTDTGTTLPATLTTIIQILTGKWQITGNQLIIYDTDGSTALYTFNLTRDGVATEFNPDLRTPV